MTEDVFSQQIVGVWIFSSQIFVAVVEVRAVSVSWRGGISPAGIPAGMDGNGVTVLGGIGRKMNGRKMNGRKLNGTPMTTSRMSH